MKNTILNGSLTSFGGKHQTFQTLVRALKVASLAIVAGILALTGNASAVPDTVITLTNGATDLTNPASYGIVTNVGGGPFALGNFGNNPPTNAGGIVINPFTVVFPMTPAGNTLDVLFSPNSGILPFSVAGATSLPDFLSAPIYNPTTLTVNQNASVGSIADQALGPIIITDNGNGIVSDTLTIGPAAGNTNNTAALPALTTPIPPAAIGTAVGAGDLIFAGLFSNLSFAPGAGTAPNQLALVLNTTGNVDNFGALTISSNVTITAAKVITFTGFGATTVSGIIDPAATTGAIVINDLIGSVTLSGANLYSGGTTLTSGTLNINNATALGTGTLSVGGGTIDNTSAAAVTVTNALTLTGTTLTFTGTKNLTFSGAITFAGATPTITVTNAGSTLFLGGAIGVTADGLTKAGAGTLDLSGNDFYAGTTTVNAGTLTLDFALSGNTSNILNVLATNNLVMNGGTFNITGKPGITNSQTLAAGGTVVNSGASTFTITNPTNVAGSNNVLFAMGAITRTDGATAVFVQPTGTIGAANGYTTTSAGGDHGILVDANATPFATIGDDWAATNGTNIVGLLSIAGSYVSNSPAALGIPLTSNNNINGGTNTTLAGGWTEGSIRFDNATALVNNNITIASSYLRVGGILIGSGNGAFATSISGAGTLEGSASTGATNGDLVIIQNDANPLGTFTISTLIANNPTVGGTAADDLTITGVTGGQVYIETTVAHGGNTYTGPTFLNGGTVEVGTGAFLAGTNTVAPFGAATVTINAPTTLTTDAESVANGGLATGNNYLLANSFVLNAALTVNVPTATSLTLSAPTAGISGLGGLTVNAGGATAGTLILNGPVGPGDSFSGPTLVQGGTLQAAVGSGPVFGFSPNSNVTLSAPVAANPGTLDLNGTSGQSIASLTGSATTVVTNSVAATTSALTITTNAGSPAVATFAGSLNNGNILGTGVLSLTVNGAATQALTGLASTYSGGTTNNGVLAIGGSSLTTPLGAGIVSNRGFLETTATSSGTAAQTINVTNANVGTAILAPAFGQTATGTLLLQVVTNQGVGAQTLAAAGAGGSYDTMTVAGSVGSTLGNAILGAINLNFGSANAPGLPGQRFQAISSGTTPINQAPTPANPTARGPVPVGVYVFGNINPNIVPVTTYNDNFNGQFSTNNISVTLYQPLNEFPGLTANQTSVANNMTNLANTLFFAPGAIFPMNYATGILPLTVPGTTLITPGAANAKAFFDGILDGAELGGGHALDELSPQRLEILHNIAFDNYAFDIQSLDNEFARERMGFGGVDTSGFTFNNSQLGPELSQVRSRLLAWSPAPEPGLLSDSSQAVLGGVAMADKKDMKEMAPMEPENPWDVFIDGGVDLGDKEGNSDLDHTSYTTGRVRLGADYRVCTDLRVGALFGYNHTDADMDNEGSKAHVDGYTPGVFVTYADKDGFYANGLFTYTANEYRTNRNIIVPGINQSESGSFSGNQFAGDLDGGYDFHRGDWTFGPSAGLTYVNLGIDSFNETGPIGALAISSQSTDSLRSRLGGTASYRAEIGSVVLTPHVSAYWQHEFLDNGTNITSSFAGLPGGNFSVQTTAGDNDNALLGAGLDAQLDQTVTLFIDYGAEAGGSTFFGQSATGGVKLSF